MDLRGKNGGWVGETQQVKTLISSEDISIAVNISQPLPHPHRWQINSKVQQENIKHGYNMCTLPFKSRFYLKTTLNTKHYQSKEMNQLRPIKRLRNGPSKPRHNASQHPFSVLGNSLIQPIKLELKAWGASLGWSLVVLGLEHEHSGLNTNTRASNATSFIYGTSNLLIKLLL